MKELVSDRGILGILLATIATAVSITLITGFWFHWPFIAAGVTSGLWAAHFVNK